MERIETFKEDAAKAYATCLAVMKEDPEVYEAASILVSLKADAALDVDPLHRRVGVDGHEECVEEAELKKGGDSVSVAEGAMTVEKKRWREKDGAVETMRRGTKLTPLRALTPALPEPPVVTRTGRTVTLPKKFD